jgi:predicted nucleotidyltransferase
MCTLPVLEYTDFMGLLTAAQIKAGLERLGQLAVFEGLQLRLALVGGAVMALAYGARDSTRDVDALFFSPPDAMTIRRLALQVALEMGFAEDWLNDGAKGYVKGLDLGQRLLAADGIEVWQISPVQLLAMKLSAWRDDTDIRDATRLLHELSGTREEIWVQLEPFLSKGDELKAQYAFADLWESLHAE